MPRKAPRRGKNAKKPAKPRGANARPGRAGSKGAGVIAGGILLAIGALLLKALIFMTPTKEQLRTFWSYPWARKATYASLALLVCLLVLSGVKSGLAEQENFTIDPASVEISGDGISWLNKEGKEALIARVQAEIVQDLSDIEASDAFDDELLTNVGEDLADNPWVANVVRITRKFPEGETSARLCAEIDIRKPVLQVKVGETLYFVDGEGVAMPLTMQVDSNWNAIRPRDAELLSSILASQAPRYVSNVRGNAPQLGKVWENEQIKAALSMERTLREHQVGKIVPIRQIDVTGVPTRLYNGHANYAASGGVILIPRTSTTQIIWGKASVHADTREPSAESKIERLKAYIDRDATLASLDEVRLNGVG